LAKKPSLSGGNYKFASISPGDQLASGLGSNFGGSIKRPPSGVAHPPPKKQKTGVLHDVSLAEAGKYGSLNEFAFFDKVKRSQFWHKSFQAIFFL
jgi:hypothetical protein